ncbi:MAG TPA: hypothetical protein VEK11_22220 [Thermoanaerobaculia bacterium]|nr:hypothetical protein [Thermoanaerobaculia bacterium]
MTLRSMRIAAAVLIAGVAAFLLYRVVALPYHCNIVRTQAEQKLGRAAEPNEYRAAEMAREVLRDIDHCLASDPTNVALLYVRARAFRILGRNEHAVAAYEQALRYDHRPEIYIDLGVAEYAIGRGESGVEHMLTAVRFLPWTVNYIESASARAQVYHRLSALYAKRGNLLVNPRFTREALEGTEMQHAGTGLAASLAAGWSAYNTTGTLTIERVPSTYPGHKGTMLHIKTTNIDAGLMQIWGDWGTGPSKVITTAKVFVNKGAAAIGSGHLLNTGYDGISKTRGQWEELRAPSGSCPVNQTWLVASTYEGADFYVAEVRADAVVSELPCDTVTPPPQ